MMPPKVCGGLVIVDPWRLANVASQGVDQIALKVAWADIEPTQGAYNFAFINQYLADYPGVRFTLRVQAGDSSPAWLKTITGGAIEVYNTARSRTAFVHRWWTEAGMDAWDAMIHALGAAFDANPRIVMVSGSSQTVVYSEPYILGSDPASGVRLFNAGLNLTTSVASIERCIDDTCDAFPNTLVELAIHKNLQTPKADGIQFSWPQGRNLANTLAARHGKHLVFSDYGLKTANLFAAHAPDVGEDLTNTSDVYTYMYLRTLPTAGAMQGPITFQLTVGTEPQVQATYAQAAQNGIDLGAWQVETAGWGLLGDLAGYYDQALKNQAIEGWPIDQTSPPSPARDGSLVYLRASGAWVPRTMTHAEE